MSTQEFQKSLNLINFSVRDHDFDELVKELSNKNHEITIQEVCNKVDAWKHNESLIFYYLSQFLMNPNKIHRFHVRIHKGTSITKSPRT